MFDSPHLTYPLLALWPIRLQGSLSSAPCLWQMAWLRSMMSTPNTSFPSLPFASMLFLGALLFFCLLVPMWGLSCSDSFQFCQCLTQWWHSLGKYFDLSNAKSLKSFLVYATSNFCPGPKYNLQYNDFKTLLLGSSQYLQNKLNGIVYTYKNKHIFKVIFHQNAPTHETLFNKSGL